MALDPTDPNFTNLFNTSPEALLKSRFNLQNVRTAFVLEGNEQDTPIAQSYLGTPIFSNVSFEKTSYRDFDDTPFTFDGFALNICLINANSQNLIVETMVQGSNYSKFESINTGNYKITVNGFLDSQQNNVAPYELIKQLNQLRKVNISVKVNSAFLNSLDVFEVVVNSVEFAEIEGTRNLIAVGLNLTSDVPIEVRLA